MEEAEWIGGRLGPMDGFSVASVAPAGFAAYARVLHPAEEPRPAGVWCAGQRYSPGAAWRSTPARSSTRSPCRRATLPARRRGGARGRRRAGCTCPTRRRLQISWLASRPPPETAGSASGTATTSPPCRPPAPAHRPPPLWPDPVPAEVRRGPRVKLPGRDYLLYAGPVEAITAYGPGRAQTANLAWPVDRAWFVASEVDLAWTYLAGSEALVEAVLADYRIEALPAGPDDPLTTIDAHVAGLVERYRCRHARRCRGSVVVASRVRLLPAVDGHPRRLGPGGRCRRSRWLAERSLWPGAVDTCRSGPRRHGRPLADRGRPARSEGRRPGRGRHLPGRHRGHAGQHRVHPSNPDRTTAQSLKPSSSSHVAVESGT